MRCLSVLSFLKYSEVGVWVATLALAVSTMRGLTFQLFCWNGFYELVISIMFLT